MENRFSAITTRNGLASTKKEPSVRSPWESIGSRSLGLTISPLLLRHSKHRCYSVPRLADTPQREELTRAPQGALPFPAKSRWARRAPLAIERKGEGNGQVQGDPQAEGHGDKHQEHRVLVRVFHGDGRHRRRQGEGARAGVAAAGGDERRGDTRGHLPEGAQVRRIEGRDRPRAGRQGDGAPGRYAHGAVVGVLRRRAGVGQGALHVLGVLPEAQEMGYGEQGRHAHRAQAGTGDASRLRRGHHGRPGPGHGRAAEGVRVRGLPALLGRALRRGILRHEGGILGRGPRARVLVLRRQRADNRPGQPEAGRGQEHGGGARRQRAVPAHGRALRLRHRPRAAEEAARQGGRSRWASGS